jgi:hypothetical protein
MTTQATSKAKTAARLVLGAIFFVFGLNGFLQFLPMPAPTGVAATFMGGMAATGYFFPLLKGTEVVAGVLLLSNRYVPLALTVLAPIVLNIVLFHAFVAPAGIVLPLVIVALGVYLAYTERAVFRPLLRAKGSDPVPTSSRSDARVPAAA